MPGIVVIVEVVLHGSAIVERGGNLVACGLVLDPIHSRRDGEIVIWYRN